jgi:hypothetical protein
VVPVVPAAVVDPAVVPPVVGELVGALVDPAVVLVAVDPDRFTFISVNPPAPVVVAADVADPVVLSAPPLWRHPVTVIGPRGPSCRALVVSVCAYAPLTKSRATPDAIARLFFIIHLDRRWFANTAPGLLHFCGLKSSRNGPMSGRLISALGSTVLRMRSALRR